MAKAASRRPYQGLPFRFEIPNLDACRFVQRVETLIEASKHYRFVSNGDR